MVYIRDGRSLGTARERNSIVTITATAYCGFCELGERVTWFTELNGIEPTKNDIVVGSIKDICEIFTRFGIALPVIEYPKELNGFFGREIHIEPSLKKLINEEKTGIFIKPAMGMKQFTGKVIKTPTDYCDLFFDEDISVYTSPVCDIVSEWRCYILRGEILDIKNYKGDPLVPPSREFIAGALSAYENAPAGYSLDIGVMRGGENMVIEINDGYSLGTYGICPLPYARLLSARYSELMGVSDPYF